MSKNFREYFQHLCHWLIVCPAHYALNSSTAAGCLLHHCLPIGVSLLLAHTQVPDPGAFGGIPMQQVVASTPLSSPVGAPQSAPPSTMDPEGSLTALLVDPSLHEPLQVSLHSPPCRRLAAAHEQAAQVCCSCPLPCRHLHRHTILIAPMCLCQESDP